MYDIPLEHIPVEDELQRLADGDESVVDVIISGLIQYTVAIIRGYVGKNPGARPYHEDLEAEGLITLTKFVKSKLGKPLDVKIVPKLAGAIKNNSHDWLRENQTTITIKARTQQNGVVPPKRHSLKEGDAVSGRDGIFEGIWNECFTDYLSLEQREVARLRGCGYSVNRISCELDIHRARVERMLKQIEHIYSGE